MKYLLTVHHVVTEEDKILNSLLNVGEIVETKFEHESEHESEYENVFEFHEFSEEDLTALPELLNYGVKVGDSVSLMNISERVSLNDVAIHETLQRYRKLYPKNKLFIVTSDNHVFLEGNRQDAIHHQKTVNSDFDVLEFDAD